MRPLTKALYALLLALLAYLAVRPYWPQLQEEATHFVEAWQTIRQPTQAPAAAALPDSGMTSRSEGQRRRDLIVPTETVTAYIAAENDPDPFLNDIRRRAKEDPEAAMHWLQQTHSGGERLRGMLEVVALWAAEDSESALLWLESNAQGIARLETLQSGVELWAQRDPEATADWIDAMANDGSKVTATRALVKQWAGQAPEAAAKWVAGLPDGEVAAAAAQALIDSWAESDPRAAAIWALAQAEFRGDIETVEYGIAQYTKKDPAAAEAFIRELVKAYDAPSLAATFAQTLAAGDPTAAVAWLSRMDARDPLYADDHARIILKTWAESDSIAASTWLGEQPGGPRRDAAISGFIETLQRFEPAAATQWAATIGSPELRQTHLRGSFASWFQQNPDAAGDWLEQADLPPAVRSELTLSESVD